MDPRRFDSLARQLSRACSRRGVLASVLGGTLGLLGFTETSARRKKHKKKHPSPRLPPSPPDSPPTQCQGSPDGALCGTGGCMICSSGVCVTSPIREEAACGNGGCLVCLSGVCSSNPTNYGACAGSGAPSGYCDDGECKPCSTTTCTVDAQCCAPTVCRYGLSGTLRCCVRAGQRPPGGCAGGASLCCQFCNEELDLCVAA
jgi:hypothetical protein